MRKENRSQAESETNKGTLGTFAGVFTPSVLTILGIILFLRLGYVVGNAGLGRTLIIIGIANVVSVLTTFSLAAISTNLKVKVGGPYYIISRTLGPEFGGSIGIVLFFAQSISIGFYCVGFGEVLANILGQSSGNVPQIIGSIAVMLLFVFAWLGADWATRFQYVVMAILSVALFSFFAGGIINWDSSLIIENWSTPRGAPDFWILFAIFFPAVTGFTQGVSMSGDLKDPGRSIPLGTFMAVGVSILVYLAVTVVFAGTIPGQILANDYNAMGKAALFEFLIHAGVIGATLSSAMASFLGAPRILQSLSGDRIFPFLLPFAKGYGPTENPRRGVLLSAGIAFATIALGNLNLIAPVVSMFFLVSYGLLNYATYFEARTASPSFRPRFRWFSPMFSLAGWLACFGAMLAIDLKAGIAAIAALFAIYQYLRRTAGPSRWADSRRSYYLQRVRENLLAASAEPEHPRNWRPQILAFSDDPGRRENLLHFASWLEGRSGITTAVKILEGEGGKMLKLKSEAQAELETNISQYQLKTFPLAMTAPNLQVGIQSLMQSYGVGPLRANIVLLNWFGRLAGGIRGLGELSFTTNLRAVFRQGCNIVLLDAKKEAWDSLNQIQSAEKIIDVWWWGDSTSKLMLLLAYLMKRNTAWEDAKIRVAAFNPDGKSDDTMEELEKMLDDVRIEAEAEILEDVNEDKIVEYSEHSSVVFLPFRIQGKGLAFPFECKPDDLISRLPVIAMVLAAEDIDLDAEPEEGKAGEMAAALDTLTDTEKKAGKAQEEADLLADQVRDNTETLMSMLDKGADASLMEKLKDSIKAREDAEKASRRAAKASAKAEDAAKTAKDLGVDTGKNKED